MSSSYRNYSKAKNYGRIGVESEVEGASPHRLVQMLMDGALARLATVRGAIERNDMAVKCSQIGLVVDIVQSLQASLDHEKGGDVAVQLEQLYDYIIRRLLLAHRHNDIEGVEEVRQLLSEIKAGWDAIAPAATSPGQAEEASPVRLKAITA